MTENRQRRLERSTDDKVIAGVCAGIARYFGVDPVLVRIVAVASMVFGGFGAVAYLAAWVLVPEQGAAKPLLGPSEQTQTVQVAAVVGLTLLAVVWIGTVGDAGFFFDGWPVLLLLVGGAVAWYVSERERGRRPEPAGGVQRPAAGADAVAGSAAGATAAPAADPSAAPTSAGAAGAFGEPGGDEPTAPLGDPPPPPPRGSWAVTALAAGGVLLALGGVAALDALDVVSLGWGAFVALAILLTGVALVASAFFGGARGLIPVGLVLAVVLGGAAAAGVSLNGGVGEREYLIVDGDDLRARYEMGIGHLRIDLRDVELAPGTTHVEADLDIGMLEILAPGARIEGGSDDWEGDMRGAGGVDVERTIVVGSGDRLLEIEAHTGIGVVVVNDDPGEESLGATDAGGSGRPASGATGADAAGRSEAAAGDGAHPARGCLPVALALVGSACEGAGDEA